MFLDSSPEVMTSAKGAATMFLEISCAALEMKETSREKNRP